MHNKIYNQQALVSCLLTLAASLLCIVPSTLTAADAPNNEEIIIEADSVSISSTQGTIEYQGNVIIKHPQVTIRGESVQLIDNNVRRRFFAQGVPASVFWTHHNETSQGLAQTIIYEEGTNTEFLNMTGNVAIQHQGNQLEGHHVEYDFIDQKMNVSSKKTTNSNIASDTIDTDRVKIILKQR